MSAIQELLSAWLEIKHDGVGIGAVIMHNEAAAELTALEAERDEWKKRAEQAAHIKEDDAVGFDWNVLTQIESLEAVAEAARAVVFEYWESPESTPSKANIAMKDLVDKVAALKGAE